ncbi:F-box/kelch-repeat protein At1g67480-like [Lolium rigidum]|uniref:F-box/kelch-repeat protein At1g67480-like n=1 Tax=Lolium rigidum TaxID=89674 RepID=UPI001F5C4B47|nr:F-box/kelch-repeat protein At1g67480-like [Lolium rigidum]
MPALVAAREPHVQAQTCHRATMPLKFPARQRVSLVPMAEKETNPHNVLIPGLPEDMAKICIALVHRSYFPAMGAVSRRWMSFIGSREFSAVRKEVRKIEELVYVLAAEAGEKGPRWEVLGEQKNRAIPPMPGLAKAGFGVVVLHGNLYVVAGYAAVYGKDYVSDEVYQYDARLNRWGALAKLNFARRDFACAEVNGIIYVAGGFGSGCNSLSSVEAYDPQQNRWTLIENLRRPRSGCFAFGLNNKLYIMGGRSSFTIGNSRSIDVYDPRRRSWEEIKRGCVMVTSHAVLGKSLFCIEWRDQRSLSVFSPSDSSWMKISVPLTGSSSSRFCLGASGGKLLLFSREEDERQSMTYDPAAAPGSEWETSELKPSGLCLCSVTIEI